MSYNNSQYGAESDNEDDNNGYKQYEIKDGFIFLIEVSSDLLKPLPELDNKSQLFTILEAINDLMSELVMTMRSSGVGIYFYNCDTSEVKNSVLRPMKNSTNGFVKLFKLNSLNLQNMKLLNDLVNDDIQSVRSISHYFDYLNNHDTENLPIIFNRLLDEIRAKKEFNRYKLLWITNNPQPYTKTQTKESLWRTINDYYNYNHYINPIFLNPTNSTQPFDTSLYKDIFINTNYLSQTRVKQEDQPFNNVNENENDDDDDDDRFGGSFKGYNKDSSVFKTIVLNNQIRESIFRIKEVRRIQFACNLILSDGPEVGGNFGCSVKGYTLYNKEQYRAQLRLHNKGESLKKVFTESSLVNTANGEIIDIEKLSNHASQEEIANYKKKSASEKKAQNNIFKGHEISGGDVVFLKKNVEELMTNYTFDHNIVDEFGFGIHDADEDEDENGSNENNVTKQVKITASPYLKLVGFRNIDKLDITYNSKPPIFVTADLNDGLRSSSSKGGYKNSFTTFSALYQSCTKLKKFAVLFGCIRKGAKPTLYAFYPTRIEYSTRNQQNEQDFPQGFLLIRLPWIEDVRSLPDIMYHFKGNQFETDETSNGVTSDELVFNLKKLFSQFFYDTYSPSDYPSPSLNYFYKIIKSELLQISLSDEDKKLIKNDVSVLKLSELRGYLMNDPNRVQLVEKINALLSELSHEDEAKRKIQNDEDTTSSTKKRKTAQGQSAVAPPVDEDGILQAWKNDEFGKFTVPQLKSFQQKYRDKIKSATKKQDLIDNIKQFLDSREV
ncbi:Ku family DNA binding and repair protein [Scheffersomyces amazonensis]|uniref:Ku family DNA binding and repair protein n=1 Tax=Scheffersomyces amazonensis TaxID=1078765 RepID=UPI00315D1D22